VEDLESVVPAPQIEFELGDSVVYPHHGAGKVVPEADVLERHARRVLARQRVADGGEVRADLVAQGATDPRWNDNALDTLKSVPGSAFQVVHTGAILHAG